MVVRLVFLFFGLKNGLDEELCVVCRDCGVVDKVCVIRCQEGYVVCDFFWFV